MAKHAKQAHEKFADRPADHGRYILHCRCCGERFSDANVFSYAGWLETQFSGTCEVCFDAANDIPRRDENGDADQT